MKNCTLAVILGLIAGTLSAQDGYVPKRDPNVPYMLNKYDTSSLKPTPQEQKNIDFTIAFYRDLTQSHHWDLKDVFFWKNEFDHNPNDPPHPDGLIPLLTSRAPNPEPFHTNVDPVPALLIAKGDFVLLMYDQPVKDPNDTTKTYEYHRFEMVRLRDGKIEEHWDIADRRLNSQNWKLAWCTKAGRTDCPKP